MKLEQIQAFLQKLKDEGRLSDQRGTPEYTKFINFYLNCRQPVPKLDQLFLQIAAEIADYESAEAKAKGKRTNRRPAQVQERFLYCIRALALNALHIRQLSEHLYLHVSLDANDYGMQKRYAPSFVTYKQLKAAVHGMLALGYLSVFREAFHDPDGVSGWPRYYKGTSKMFDAISAAIGTNPIHFYSDFSRSDDEIIILKNSQGSYVGYNDNDYTHAARLKLQRINAMLAMHDIKLDVPEAQQDQFKRQMLGKYEEAPEHRTPYIDSTAIRLYRVFSEGSFERGGRFYRGWWQNVPEDFRSCITIDGQPTVEWDYATFHPTILYAGRCLTPPEKPYEVKGVDRKTGKAAFNALLNAKAMPKKSAPPGYTLRYDLPWTDYLEAMCTYHEPVADLLTDGYGLTLQYKDSELAESILLHFTDKGIPCLPIHDSFIVPEQYGDELKIVMLEQFVQHFGMPIQVS